MKTPIKKELQQIAPNHSSDIKFKDLIKLYKDYATQPYLLLMNNTTLPLDTH